MHPERMTFENPEGERLAALLDRPVDGDPIAYALFAHCFTCSKDLKAANDVSRALAAQGIAVLRFDFTGIGESEGEFSETTFSSNVTDRRSIISPGISPWKDRSTQNSVSGCWK